jgi:hypothetical protein
MSSISFTSTVNHNHHGLTLARRITLALRLIFGKANPIAAAWNAASDSMRDEAVTTIGIEAVWGTLCRVL